MKRLFEHSKKQLINKSKFADNYATDQSKGKNRYQRRVHSSIQKSVSNLNSIDMNKLFKDGILIVNLSVKGETDNYTVQVKFDSFLDEIHEQLKTLKVEKVDLRIISRALINSFNSKDVYVHCSCPDFNYRFSYWSLVNDISSDPSMEQKDNGKKIVNPNDTKGAGCKHILLVLSNHSWIRSLSSTIYNYINYMEKHYKKLYADVIYPALYEKEYAEDDVQLTLDDTDELATDSGIIDTSNKWAKTKTQFKNDFKNNTDREIKGQQKSFDYSSLSDEKNEQQ